MLVLAAGPHGADTPTIPLPLATGRSVTQPLDQTPAATFATDTDDPAVAQLFDDSLDGRSHDLFVYWLPNDSADPGTRIFRGRIIPASIELGADTQSVAGQALGYRGVLGHQLLAAAPSFSGVPQHTIAWDLIDALQAETGGDLGITRGIHNLANNRTRTDWQVGKPIGDCIAELARDVGFEWEISPERELNCWTPQRGTDKSADRVLAWPENLQSAASSAQLGEWGNVAIATGDPNSTTPVIAEAGDLSTDPRGRWPVVHSSSNVTRQTTLDERAPSILNEITASVPDWTVTLQPDVWGGPSDLWIGDTVALDLRSGGVAVSTTARISTLTITADDDGDEEITMELTTP